jgi:hypothetical protein
MRTSFLLLTIVEGRRKEAEQSSGAANTQRVYKRPEDYVLSAITTVNVSVSSENQWFLGKRSIN